MLYTYPFTIPTAQEFAYLICQALE